MWLEIHILKRKALCRGCGENASGVKHVRRLSPGTKVLRASMRSAGGEATSCFCMPCAIEIIKDSETAIKEIKES